MKRIFKKATSVLVAVALVFGSLAFGYANVDWSEFAIEAEAAEEFTEGYYTYIVDEND